MSDLLLLHGTVITVDRDRRVIEDGAVAISGDKIVEVGTSADLEPRHVGKKVIDCRGKLVIPGIVDAHGHAGHSLIKTIATDSPSVWMRVVTAAYYHYTTRDFWYADGLVSGIERLRAGVTTGASIIASMPRSDDPMFGINHAKAYTEVGIKEILCVGPAGQPWPHPVTRWETGKPVRHQVSFEQMIEGTEAVIEAVHGSADGRIKVYLTPFTIVPSVDPSNPTTPDKAVNLTADDRMQARRVRETARKWGVRIHSDAFAGQIRMAFQDKENMLLGPDIHLQHCIGISHEEVDILAETGTHMTHSPGGRAPILDMISKGVNVAITSDGTSPRRPFDMFQMARMAQFAQHMLQVDQYLLPPGKLLEMITIDAARALGLDHEIGSLEAGKQADVAILDLRQPHLTPNWMPVHRLMYQAIGSDVETVIVDGKVLMEDRKVLTTNVIDALDFGEREARALVERAGLREHMHDPGWGKLSRTFTEPVVPPAPPAVD
ncbi:amidohydrolase family protein [Paradevosia shaoguanensis]|uniref:Amidohydrolase family protein n=1 Tax=Paradevosia shaoguanensis TaxID=1335043 RepID=A0AA41U9Y8_9HYPH|nr:amidohydrolase family protein [Paradevosia shaoguanensis]MCF1741392.1 amidohydrolase family protein [Paradevosia shaoguanensis]MCI0125875.1 amidohydrolase family protein [Paradevosia shaoguanensis]QMV03221.1 amidohydrolase family protein [Devosia sp. D6-9]